jgi:hypothetical protein
MGGCSAGRASVSGAGCVYFFFFLFAIPFSCFLQFFCRGFFFVLGFAAAEFFVLCFFEQKASSSSRRFGGNDADDRIVGPIVGFLRATVELAVLSASAHQYGRVQGACPAVAFSGIAGVCVGWAEAGVGGWASGGRVAGNTSTMQKRPLGAWDVMRVGADGAGR